MNIWFSIVFILEKQIREAKEKGGQKSTLEKKKKNE